MFLVPEMTEENDPVVKQKNQRPGTRMTGYTCDIHFRIWPL